MKKYFVAKSVKDHEYLYNKASAILVPTASARKICDALNNIKYQLKAGEIWHIHENDFYIDDFIPFEIKRVTNSKFTISYR